jgi:hypothetical protein
MKILVGIAINWNDSLYTVVNNYYFIYDKLSSNFP